VKIIDVREEQPRLIALDTHFTRKPTSNRLMKSLSVSPSKWIPPVVTRLRCIVAASALVASETETSSGANTDRLMDNA